MKTLASITMKVLGTGTGYFTIPPGVTCSPAHNLPKKDGAFQYWVCKWPGMSKDAEAVYNATGILVTIDEIRHGNQ